MEFGSPVKQTITTYIAPVQTTNVLDIKYTSIVSGSNTSPPPDRIEVKQYVSAMAIIYESYSVRWFNRRIPAFFFLQNTSHTWDYSSSPPYTSPPSQVGSTIVVHQIWRPESITIHPKLFQINWVLQNSDYTSYSVTNPSPGTAAESEEIPYGENQIHFVLEETPRSIFHRKIRTAKLAAATANLRVKKLYLKYYKRYGEFVPNGKESPLSSDDEIE